MSKEGNERVATYYYGRVCADIYRCWPDDDTDFYEVYSCDGVCLTEGQDLCETFPTYEEVKALLETSGKLGGEGKKVA